MARELYAAVKDLPLVSPHGHVDPGLFAENKPFPDPAALIIIPDHYIFRMLYSQGIPLESLGVPAIDGTPVETDHRKIWQIFGEHFHLFAGTPTGVWLAHELSIVFGVKVKLTGGTAPEIYDHIQQKLQTPAFRPRALFDRFNIALLTTTDPAEATLEAHQAIRASGWHGNVIPCFRPDGVVNLAHPDWRENIAALGKVSRTNIGSYRAYIQALEERRTFFKSIDAI
ncbi:MAG: glucuronate isomerase [Candidatus Marinimicrobia bacterium]|nr:glucuronate isomerase [Candidatus Neomarinimicrobiota bacterium]